MPDTEATPPRRIVRPTATSVMKTATTALVLGLIFCLTGILVYLNAPDILNALNLSAQPDMQLTQAIGFGMKPEAYVNGTVEVYEKAYGAIVGIYSISEARYEVGCSINSSVTADLQKDNWSQVTFQVVAPSSRMAAITAKANSVDGNGLVASINAVIKESKDREERETKANVEKMMAGISNLKTITTHSNGTIEEKIEFPNGGETIVNIYPGGVGYVADSEEEEEEGEGAEEQAAVTLAQPTRPTPQSSPSQVPSVIVEQSQSADQSTSTGASSLNPSEQNEL